MRFSKMLSVVSVSAVLALLSVSAFSTALTDDRDTAQRAGDFAEILQGSNVIYGGSMVAVNLSGYAVPAADTAGLSVIGRAEAYSDNTGANYLSTKTIQIGRGVFRWANGSSITNGEIGQLAYCLDDQTVKTSGITNNIIAGVIVEVDTSGVWVDTFDIGSQGSVTPSSLAVSGAGTVGSTLAVGSTLTAGNLTSTGATSLGATTATGATGLRGTTTANIINATGAVTAASTVGLRGTTTINDLVVTGAWTYVETMNAGTNTALWTTNCPGPLANNQPTWFKFEAANGTNYVFPAFTAP